MRRTQAEMDRAAARIIQDNEVAASFRAVLWTDSRPGGGWKVPVVATVTPAEKRLIQMAKIGTIPL